MLGRSHRGSPPAAPVPPPVSPRCAPGAPQVPLPVPGLGALSPPRSGRAALCGSVASWLRGGGGEGGSRSPLGGAGGAEGPFTFPLCRGGRGSARRLRAQRSTEPPPCRPRAPPTSAHRYPQGTPEGRGPEGTGMAARLIPEHRQAPNPLPRTSKRSERPRALPGCHRHTPPHRPTLSLPAIPVSTSGTAAPHHPQPHTHPHYRIAPQPRPSAAEQKEGDVRACPLAPSLQPTPLGGGHRAAPPRPALLLHPCPGTSIPAPTPKRSGFPSPGHLTPMGVQRRWETKAMAAASLLGTAGSPGGVAGEVGLL